MSYEHSKSLKEYVEKRARRILPAYCFVVVLCAACGLFFSTLPWNQYFNQQLGEYLFFNLAFLNFVQPSLPGVFEQNPLMSSVNGSLWTIKVELMFYASVPLLALLLRRYNKLILIAAIYVLSFFYNDVLNLLGEQTGHTYWFELARQIPGQLDFFMGGALLYYYFDVFKAYFKYLLPFAVLVLVISAPFEMIATEYYDFSFLTPIALAIVVLSIAFFTPYIDTFSKHGDLSYGIYIYHFPLAQILISYGLYQSHPFLTLLFTTVVLLVVAYASWHLLEKPFLHQKQAAKLKNT